MVCEKCEKKLSKVIVPDKWKEGVSNTTEGGGRKVNENKLLSKKKRWTPYGNTKCMICKQQVHQDGKYCHTCAYSKDFRYAAREEDILEELEEGVMMNLEDALLDLEEVVLHDDILYFWC